MSTTLNPPQYPAGPEWEAFQADALRTVGAIWLDDGSLAGWQLSLDTATGDDAEYLATCPGEWLHDQDEILDPEDFDFDFSEDF